MKKNILNRIIPLALTFMCAAAIFMFSMQNGTDSAQVSNGLLSHILRFIEKLTFITVTPDEIEHYSHLMRKAAHLFIYLLLGILSCWSAWALFLKRYFPISLCFCFAYACTDEFHQLFSDGRSAAFTDVLIDTAGSVIGIVYMTLIIACIRSINRSAGESIDKS